MNKKNTWIVLVLLIFGVSFIGYYLTRPKSNTMTDSEAESVTAEESSSSDTTATEGYIDISPTDAYQLMQNNSELIVIDVSPNYSAGHLPGAINYYVGDGSLDEAIPTLDKTNPYLVYCHLDSASISGATKLIDAGFDMVYRLEGNYAAWTAAGLPTEK